MRTDFRMAIATVKSKGILKCIFISRHRRRRCCAQWQPSCRCHIPAISAQPPPPLRLLPLPRLRLSPLRLQLKLQPMRLRLPPGTTAEQLSLLFGRVDGPSSNGHSTGENKITCTLHCCRCTVSPPCSMMMHRVRGAVLHQQAD